VGAGALCNFFGGLNLSADAQEPHRVLTWA
jgi:hypothetical protein